MTGKETDKGIWCLFRIENNYDQPDNDLERFWFNKPSLEALGNYLGKPLDKAKDEDVMNTVAIWQGYSTVVNKGLGTRYRLQYVEEGKSL